MTGEAYIPVDPQKQAEIAHAIVNLNCDASMALVRRTRYAVRDAAIVLREQRIRQRRNMGLTLFAVLIMLILLAPAVWDSVEDLLAGEYLSDLSSQVSFLLLTLAPAMLAVFAAIWRGQRNTYQERHDF